ncbi:hypothetical protein [Dysosmobacter sp.]|uniref:hypothetical protein n=1 Tax=Dysosmobacter sp. TaxID=2591382 RepID=UPI0026726079|nr:hypothetical protein [Dysosmobacter sp.]MCI7282128.1 hypothetical protein [Dysosmobacter sp.]
MASQQTPNYKLSRWAGTDRILVEEFNDNWDKIDAALKGNADAVAAETAARDEEKKALQALIGQRGNCFVEFGSYTGTGNRLRTMTFSHKPILVIIRNCTNYSSPLHLVMIQGAANANGYENSSAASVALAWSGNSVSITTSSSAAYSFDRSDEQYFYAALLMAE